MGRPTGSTNCNYRSDRDCIERIDVDTEKSIRTLCKEHGITATRFFDLSNLNAPTHSRPMSYSRFGQAMAGRHISEEHNSMLARSILNVQQELRRQNIRPLMDSLPENLTTLLRAHFANDNKGVFTAQEISDLRGIVHRALARGAYAG